MTNIFCELPNPEVVRRLCENILGNFINDLEIRYNSNVEGWIEKVGQDLRPFWWEENSDLSLFSSFVCFDCLFVVNHKSI